MCAITPNIDRCMPNKLNASGVVLLIMKFVCQIMSDFGSLYLHNNLNLMHSSDVNGGKSLFVPI